MISRDTIPHTRRWVVKIGSALLTGNGQGLNREILSPWVEQMAAWQPHKLHACHCTDLQSRIALSRVADIEEVGVVLELTY